MSAAATFDLTVTASAAFYFLVVRPGYRSWWGMAAVALAGARAAGFLLPEAEQPYVQVLKWAAVPLEIGVIASIVRRMRFDSPGGDRMDQMRTAVAAVIPSEGVARVVAAELAVLYYALLSWRAKTETKRGFQVFSCAEASGYRVFGTVLVLLILFETAPAHMVVAQYSVATAWVLTALSGYAVLWAVAMIRSAGLRPVLLNDDWLKVRAGILWEADIARDEIVSCRRVVPGFAPARERGYLMMVVVNEPQFVIELRHPARALGPYGKARMFRKIAIAVDEPEAFEAAMNR